jgi:hypothetical protein
LEETWKDGEWISEKEWDEDGSLIRDLQGWSRNF